VKERVIAEPLGQQLREGSFVITRVSRKLA